jgi:hypothetical protein
MTIETVFETEAYSYDFDTQYGTGWFVRKADDHVSLMDTGVEAEEWVHSCRTWFTDQCSKCVADFNNEAEQRTYSPRWSDSNETN